MSAQKQPTQQFDATTDPRAMDARVTRVKFKSQDDRVNLGSLTRVRIPNVHNGLLATDATTLSLTIPTGSEITGTGAVAPSNIRFSPFGISSAISRVTLYAGGNVIQDLQSYAEIYAMLRSASSPVSSFGYSSVTELTAGGSSVVNGGPGLLDGTNMSRYFTATSATKATLAQDLHFEVPLLGLLSSSRHLPLFQLNDDLVVELTFSPNIDDFFYTKNGAGGGTVFTGSTVAFTNVGMNCKLIRCSDFGCEQIRKQSGMSPTRPMSWSSISYCTDFTQVPISTLNSGAAVQTVNKVGGLKPRSLVGYMVTGFSSTNTSSQIKHACIMPAHSLQARIGGELWPPQPLQNTCQLASGALLVAGGQHALTSLTNVFSRTASRMDEGNASRQLNVSGDTVTPRAVAGYPLCNEADQVGLDSSGSTIEMITRISKNTVAPFNGNASTPLNLFTLLKYNCVYSISMDGQFTVAH